MDTISDTFAGMLNDIESDGNVGTFVEVNASGEYVFHRCLPSVTYVFDDNEIYRMWMDLYSE